MMQEDCATEADGGVRLKPGIKKRRQPPSCGRGRRRGRGRASPPGTRLGPAELGLAAALGHDELPVFRRLRVALLSTGDEVRDPGAALPPGAIYDANRYMLAALLAGLGCRVTDFGIRPDREAALADTLAAAAAEHDLIVTSGGVSTGEEDHVKAAIERLGHLHFWRLAIKPGRPVALGQIGRVPLIGLPGNPVAVIVTFAILARPLILKLAGAAVRPPQLFPAQAAFSYRKKAGTARISARPGRARRRPARRHQASARRGGHPVLGRAVGRARHPRRNGRRPRPRRRRRFPALRRGHAMKILYFAWLRARIGCAEEEVALPQAVHDVGGLLDWLGARGGGYAEALQNRAVVRVAVNHDYVGPDHPVKDGDEIAIFPPVTGG